MIKDTETLEKIAVLIDADNAQLSKLKLILDEISTHGRIIVKKAYGDWKNAALKKWEDELSQLAIKPEQQFAYVTGKNATDIAMVIDAMDLLHTEIYDAFVLISSDSDFTPLAIRLRESGVFVFGVGEEKTPQSFKNACDDFILTEYLTTVSTDEAVQPLEQEEAAPLLPADRKSGLDEIHELLKIAHTNYQDVDGWVNVSAAGSYIKRVKPDFSPRTYGFSKLPDLLSGFPEKYTMQRTKGKGNSTIIAYTCAKPPEDKQKKARGRKRRFIPDESI